MKKFFIFIFFLLLTPLAWSASINDKIFAYALNGESAHLINAEQDRIVATVNPINKESWGPQEIAITPNQQFAYVANDNRAGFPSFSNVAIIDTQSNLQVGEVSGLKNDTLFTTISIAPNGTYGYIGERNPKHTGAIEIFDTATNKIIGSVNNFEPNWVPQKIAFTPDGKKAIVVLKPTLHFANVLIVDTATHSVIKHVGDTKHEYEDVVITPDGKTAYFASSFNQKEVMILDLQTDQIIKHVAIHDDIYHSPYRMTMTPDGSKIYIIDTTPFISILDTKTNSYIGELVIQHPPFSYSDIAISPDGTKGYLAGLEGISVFDVKTDKEIGKMIIPHGVYSIRFFQV